MSRYLLTHLPDARLLAELPRIAARDRATTAELLAHLAEAELRRLYAAAGYPSMVAYCVGHLRYSEAAAEKRVHAARVANKYPVLFEMLADGRLSLTTVLVLIPALKMGNAHELIAAAAGKSRSEIEWLLAQRFPRPDVFAWGTESASGDSGNEPAPGQLAPSLAPGTRSFPVPSPSATMTPLGDARVALQVTVSRATQQKLQRAKELLGFEVADNDTAAVLERALEALIVTLEKRRLGRHTKHRAGHAQGDSRHVPSALREAVAEHDGEQCAFVSDDGHRCESRHALEFDHILPLAKGGVTRADNLRLLCPAHNQYEADRKLGRTFMNTRRAAQPPLLNHARDAFPDSEDVRAGLIALGFRKDQLAPAMEFAAGLPRDTTASERVRTILRLRGARSPDRVRGRPDEVGQQLFTQGAAGIQPESSASTESTRAGGGQAGSMHSSAATGPGTLSGQRSDGSPASNC